MAGSIKWFQYTANGGDLYAFRADESNIEAVAAAVGDYTGAPGSTFNALPRNLRPRLLVYKTQDGLRTKRIIAPTPAVFANPPNPITPDTDAPGREYFLRELIGERLIAPFGFDTGLDDGDNT